MNQDEIDQVTQIFQNLGAEKDKAVTMASQLIKRAEQLANEKESSKVAELQTLLETAIYGAQGNLKPDKMGILKKIHPETPKNRVFCEKV